MQGDHLSADQQPVAECRWWDSWATCAHSCQAGADVACSASGVLLSARVTAPPAWPGLAGQLGKKVASGGGCACVAVFKQVDGVNEVG